MPERTQGNGDAQYGTAGDTRDDGRPSRVSPRVVSSGHCHLRCGRAREKRLEFEFFIGHAGQELMPLFGVESKIRADAATAATDRNHEFEMVANSLDPDIAVAEADARP